jgi:hypothetical protein
MRAWLARSPGHKFMALRRTVKNAKGRYVTIDQFASFGLFWAPSNVFKTRDELALALSHAILVEAGV